MRRLKTLLFACRMRLSRGARISVDAYLKGHARIQVGRKTKIHADASLDASRGGRIVLGDGVTINRYAMLQGDAGGVTLGNGVEVNNHTIINGTGGVRIGHDTLIGPGVRIISYQHQTLPDRPIRAQPTVARPILIGDGVWIGANAIILAGVTIGDGAVVGAGAVVTRDVPAQAVVVGTPARIARYR